MMLDFRQERFTGFVGNEENSGQQGQVAPRQIRSGGNVLPDSNSVLTVGGRALTKHSHRDHTSSWWGICKGSEQDKNDHAFKKMTEIMDSAAWMNVHELPGELPTIEIRQKNGYGVRWTCDGAEFRGFVEPQMADGHVVGWIH
ncbi:hypothetical protein HELRODRAFT_166678 [Helobdella robusta]|uniref:Uncharacterized protein n=1 Tax=Helobdella robusta TaxID=6412 RepID=T1EYC6_HELRO|nr:hypothetical protein HELRODRAFT_166678 [Helobdella robusta]ESO11664.1 hypothetical protein HELRODRAFT_166678 [Helobdella robusta]